MSQNPDIIEVSTGAASRLDFKNIATSSGPPPKPVSRLIDSICEALPDIFNNVQQAIDDPESWEYIKSASVEASETIKDYCSNELESGRVTEAIDEYTASIKNWFLEDEETIMSKAKKKEKTKKTGGFLEGIFGGNDAQNNTPDGTDPNFKADDWWLGAMFPFLKTPRVRALAEGVQWGCIGSIIGYCVGAAIKRLGVEVATWAGMGFITVQVLSYFGYVGKVRYDKMYKDILGLFGLDDLSSKNVDKLVNHAKQKKNHMKEILTKDLPSAAGFSAGLFLGLAR